MIEHTIDCSEHGKDIPWNGEICCPCCLTVTKINPDLITQFCKKCRRNLLNIAKAICPDCYKAGLKRQNPNG